MRKLMELDELVVYIGDLIKSEDRFEHGPSQRQEMYPWFNQTKLNEAKILGAGCGAMANHFAFSIVKAGIGELDMVDYDIVEMSNLNRQMFLREDLYKNKAKAMAKHLAHYSITGTRIKGVAMSLEDYIQKNPQAVDEYDLVVVLVDNERTRHFASDTFLHKCPVIFAGVSKDSETGYVMLQETEGRPCYKCFDRRDLAGASEHEVCDLVPSIAYIHQVIGGYCTFIAVSKLVGRALPWYKKVLNLRGRDAFFGKPNDLCDRCTHI